MPAGIDDIIASAAADIVGIAADILSVASELAKLPRPDYNKATASNERHVTANTPVQPGRR